MRKIKFWLSMALCFAMVINPLIFEVALYAADAAQEDEVEVAPESAMEETEDKTEEASEKTEEAYDTLSTTKKAKTKWYMSSDTKEKIQRANSELDNAKTQVGDVKDSAKDASGEVKAIGATLAGDDSALDKLAKVKAGVQKALIKTGQLLQKIGNLLKTVGQALQLTGKALSSIPWTAAIGQALMEVGKVLVSTGTMLDNIGKVIENIGQTAADADANFGDMLKQVFDAGKKGWKDGWAEAESFEQSLNDEDAEATNTSESMGDASDDIDADAGEDDIVDDVEQEEIEDF